MSQTARAQQQEVQIPDASYILYSKQDRSVAGKGISTDYYIGGDLPYPFTGMEKIVQQSDGVNLVIYMGDVVYKLQTVRMIPRVLVA